MKLTPNPAKPYVLSRLMRWSTVRGTTLEKTLVLSGLVVLIVGGVILTGTLRFNPNLVSTVDVRSERLSFDVLDPSKAAFFVAGAKIGSLGNGEPSDCSSGLFTPARGASVSYGRVGRGDVEITVTPGPAGAPVSDGSGPGASGSFEPADSQSATTYRGATDIIVDESCKPPPSQRFPIWGYLRIGQEFRPAISRNDVEPSFLLSGKLEVAAHAIFTRTLYEVTSVSLPVGARLQTAASSQGGDQPEQAIWWGTATSDPDQVALEVLAATEAPSLALYRPNQTKADVIELSKLAQLTHDPTIIFCNFLLGIVLFFLGACASLSERWQNHQEKKAKADKDTRDAMPHIP